MPLHTSLESRSDNRPGGASGRTTGEAGTTVDAAPVDTARANQSATASWTARLLLPVILVAQLMVVLDMSIVNVALPDMQHALSLLPHGPLVGAQRLHPGLRWPAAARRSRR